MSKRERIQRERERDGQPRNARTDGMRAKEPSVNECAHLLDVDVGVQERPVELRIPHSSQVQQEGGAGANRL
jgi:hypothetical protein